MNFSEALDLLKQGKRLARRGWNGKGMFVFLVPGSTFEVNREPLLGILGEGTEVSYHGHLDLKMADGTITPWLAAQPDVLADDWFDVGAAEKEQCDAWAQSVVAMLDLAAADIDALAEKFDIPPPLIASSVVAMGQYAPMTPDAEGLMRMRVQLTEAIYVLGKILRLKTPGEDVEIEGEQVQGA